MADGATSSVEVRPLPTLEEFARFLLDRDGADEGDCRHAHMALLSHYAAVWANYEGIPNRVAQEQARVLHDEWERSLLTADELAAEDYRE